MRYIIDHDYHIHSTCSLCCHDPEQTKDAILKYAKENGLKRICITDHFWDEKVPFWDNLESGPSRWYAKQDFAHISEILPLPREDGIEFLFGCETEMDKFMTVGVSKEKFDVFDFIIIPTTHLHMRSFVIDEKATLEERAEAYVKRFEAVLNQDLPYNKVGIAHLTCGLIASMNKETAKEDYVKVLNMVSDADFRRLFAKSAELGCGIELNIPLSVFGDEAQEANLRPYRIAKEMGNKFYMGSDAHSVLESQKSLARFNACIDALDLKESDKFYF